MRPVILNRFPIPDLNKIVFACFGTRLRSSLATLETSDMISSLVVALFVRRASAYVPEKKQFSTK